MKTKLITGSLCEPEVAYSASLKESELITNNEFPTLSIEPDKSDPRFVRIYTNKWGYTTDEAGIDRLCDAIRKTLLAAKEIARHPRISQ